MGKASRPLGASVGHHQLMRFALGVAFAVVATSNVYAGDGSPLRGNPMDTLPTIQAPQVAPPTFHLQAPTQEQALQALLARKIVPAKFGIEGVKSIPFETVARLFAPLAGHQVTIGELVARANDVTKLYQQHGYLLSFGFVPAQDFKNGFVKIVVVEGYVAHTRITGNPGPSRAKLEAIAAHIQAERPLKRATFERYLNVLTLVPGMRIKADMKPPTRTDGATDLTLDVQRKPITVGVSLGTSDPGLRGLITVTTNGLTPLGEQMQFATIVPKGPNHEEYYAASYSQMIGSNGLSLKLDASHYRGVPHDQTLIDDNLTRHIDNKRAGATLSYPFVLNNQRRLVGSGGVYAVENSDSYQSTVSAANATSKVNIRVVNAQLSYNETTPKQARSASIAIYKGINGLGADQSSNSPALGPYDLGFTRYVASASQSFVLPHQFGVVLAATGQYSPNTVPTPEQATFGGTRFGLGYPAGEVAGDSGWGASIEFNRLFRTGFAWLKTVQPYVEADTARVYLNRGQLQHDRLASLALGVRVSDQRHYTFDLSLAKPVADKPANSNNRSLRVNAAYSYRFD